MPLPVQGVQGVLMTWPRPPQRGQTEVDCICMPMKFWVVRTWPVPWHWEQVSTVPSALPVPLQLLQFSMRR